VSGDPKIQSGYSIFRRVLNEQRDSWPQFVGILLLSLAVAPLVLVPAFAMKIAVDCYLGDKDLPPFVAALVPDSVEAMPSGKLAVAIAMLLSVAVIALSLRFAKRVLQARTKEDLILRFRLRLFPHVERLSLSYHDQKGSADSTFRVLFDTAVVPAVLLDGMIPLAASLLAILVMTTVIAIMSWQLALVGLFAAPALLLITAPYGKKLRKGWHRVKELDSQAMAQLQETFSAVRVIKAFGNEQYETDRLEAIAREGMKAKIDVAITRAHMSLRTDLFGAVSRAGVLLIGLYLVKDDSITLGDMVMAGALLVQLYTPLQTMVGQVATMQASLVSAERALNLLDEIPEVTERPDAQAIERAHGQVSFEDVAFAYDDGKPILRGVTFTVEAGQRIGLIGRTGSGKTTITNLLTRLYDPKGGAIRLDGIDLRDLRIDDLRQQFSVVLQDPVLFKKSISENIRYARPDASMEDVIEAARLAHADEFITTLPDGYDTIVGERGMRLSGGERQRISLARAFLKDAPILILDEPTSSVDLRTEDMIMDALQRLLVNRTSFTIAHRANTLKDCDKVLCLDDGTVTVFDPETAIMSLEDAMRGDKAASTGDTPS
jgi:ATP-binding cassette subfamily B protein